MSQGVGDVDATILLAIARAVEVGNALSIRGDSCRCCSGDVERFGDVDVAHKDDDDADDADAADDDDAEADDDDEDAAAANGDETAAVGMALTL